MLSSVRRVAPIHQSRMPRDPVGGGGTHVTGLAARQIMNNLRISRTTGEGANWRCLSSLQLCANIRTTQLGDDGDSTHRRLRSAASLGSMPLLEPDPGLLARIVYTHRRKLAGEKSHQELPSAVRWKKATYLMNQGPLSACLNKPTSQQPEP